MPAASSSFILRFLAAELEFSSTVVRKIRHPRGEAMPRSRTCSGWKPIGVFLSGDAAALVSLRPGDRAHWRAALAAPFADKVFLPIGTSRIFAQRLYMPP